MNPKIAAWADQIVGLAENIKTENAAARPPIDLVPPIDRPPITEPPPTQPGLPAGATTLVFVTEFETAEEWDQTMGPPGIPGVYAYGGWMIPGHPEQITSAACEPGAPGRGQRHWTGPGANNNSGSLKIEPFTDGPKGEFWVELRLRYQPGLTFSQYHKIAYFDVGTTHAMICEPMNGGTESNIWTHGGQNHMASSKGCLNLIDRYDWFTLLMHVKTDTNGHDGIGEMWLNDQPCLDERAVNYGGATWEGFISQENMSERCAGEPMYIDVSRIRVWV